jgi:hypothetical protein
MSRGYFSLICFLLLALPNCRQKTPSSQSLADPNLKRGQIVTCGAPDQQFGFAEFETSCSEKSRKDLISASNSCTLLNTTKQKKYLQM